MDPIIIDAKTIESLQKLITGDIINNDSPLSPYRSGPDLINFFNQFGRKDTYGQGFPSRWKYAELCIAELNGKPEIIQVIEKAVDPRVYLGTEYSIYDSVDYLNQCLEYEECKLTKIGNKYKLSPLNKEVLTFEHAILDNNSANIEFIREQTFKCKSKINTEDYDGAITNARSLLEAVLHEIQHKITDNEEKYDGDLNKLYKRVQKLLNLEPSRDDISNSLKQLLTGIVSIIGGLGSVRNKMSDAHARSYKPLEHHAKLAVNSAYTLCIFLLESFEHQVKSGHLKLAPKKTGI